MRRQILTVGLTFAMASAWTCCAVSPLNKQVIFGTQVNLVVWDSARMTEHFVRAAQFETKSADLGFIAPTPTIPDLGDADKEVFNVLEALEPLPPPNSDSVSAAASEMKSGSIEVVQEQDVAGYRATTLRASDASALAQWMKENGYTTTPGIQKWTEFYIQKDWYLTTFKVKSTAGNAATGAVRMSFKTDKPFNPYVVPEDNRGGTGGLVLYYVGAGVANPSVGPNGGHWQEPVWHTEIGAFPAGRIGELIGLKDGLPAGLHVSKFEDYSFPNDAPDDLYISEGPVSEPFPVGTGIAIGAGLGAALGVAIAVIRKKKGLDN